MNTKTILVVAAIVVVLGASYAIAETGSFWNGMMGGYGTGNGMMGNGGMMGGYGTSNGMMGNGSMMGNGGMMGAANGVAAGSQCGAATSDYGANTAP